MRRRIVTIAVATAAIAILLFGIPLAAVVGKYLLDDERAELTHIGDVAALTIAVQLAEHTPLVLPTNTAGAVVALYDTSARRILGTGPAPPTPPPLRPSPAATANRS